MKLKKVVSLALAGVLAVSMLAGCGTKGEEPEQGEPAATGYSAEFGKYVDTKLDYVTFADNAADQAALQAQVDSMSDTEVVNASGWNQGTSVFEKKAELDVANFGTFAFTQAQNTNINVDYKFGNIYVADGTKSLSSILEDAANDITGSGKRLTGKDGTPEQGKDAVNGLVYDYHYTVSVSVVKRDVTTAIGGVSFNAGSRYFVAVTVTRTSTAA